MLQEVEHFQSQMFSADTTSSDRCRVVVFRPCTMARYDQIELPVLLILCDLQTH